ncbi:MAG TPA: hypothetical protein VFN97_02930 [Actinospica sp.]|nr:hypothetical protein [Actinospica sp.]
MDSWSDRSEGPRPRAADQSVRRALSLPTESECPGRAGLCGLPLAPGEALCANCGDAPPPDPRGSASLRRQIRLPDTPECPGCRRPMPQAGEVCRWCRDQAPTTASPALHARIEARTIPECPGDGGLCGAPLPPGEALCGACKQSPAQADSVEWEQCKGRGGTCGRLVLPGRGQCLSCRQSAGVSQITTFTAR